MRTVHVLTPPAGSEYAAVALEYLAPYRAAFAQQGLELVALPWTQAVAPAAAEAAGVIGDSRASGPEAPASAGETSIATLALFAWGYHLDLPAWDALLADWPADRPLFNPPALLAWNTRKTYLRELAAQGLPVVPSRFGPLDAAAIEGACAAFGCDELVAKPQVSAGSWQTVRLRRGDPVAPLAQAILQPFLPAIGAEGELSFLFVGGAFSHAVRKVAAAGDFRIQPQFGGRFSRFDPDPADLALAARILAAAPGDPLYARIDLIRLPDGTLALMELEAIEPDLYAAQEPAVAGRLADALLARL